MAPMMTDCSDGFMITVFPVTSAALTMPHKIAIGKFHGAMTSATRFLEGHPCSGDGAFSFGYASFGSVADDLVWLARIDRGKHVVGPNLFAVDRERNFARKLLALFAERSPHFFLVFGQREVR